MKNFIILFIFFTVQILFAQNSLKILVRDKEANIPLIGANVYIDSLKIGATTDVNGLAVLENVPNGDFIITAQYVGYESETLKISFPLVGENLPVTILLKNEAFKTQQITVTATRNNGIVKDIPIRVEVLGHEEVNEEIAIRPGNISKLLSETSGIHVQQTSVASGNVTFRLQGLPGGYTQMLKDGFPIYSGFSSGLSLLQIPPLDLRQVEVIKGSLSSLYGNGAIAGIVNLVSKEPAEKNSWSIILNQTHKQGTDISSYYSGTFDKIGITFLASQSMQNAVDVDKDGFSDIPQFSQTNLNPRFFYRFNTSASLMFGLSSFFEDRQGGEMDAIKNGVDSLHTYIEKNKTRRFNTQLKFEKHSSNDNVLIFKNTFNYYNRNISILSNFFDGKQNYSYSELSYLIKNSTHSFVFGLNMVTDSFHSNSGIGKYNHYTLGAFVQDDWKLNSNFIIQPGFRIDYHNKYKFFYLPHLSFLYNLLNNLSFRLTGGFGYKAPNLYNSIQNDYILASPSYSILDLNAEKSKSLNFDVNYIFFIAELVFNLNQSVFYTNVEQAILPPKSENEIIDNSGTSLISKGFDTNLIISLDELSLFIDYTNTDVHSFIVSDSKYLELTPKHKLNMTLSFEEENEWRAGIEAFYTGEQYLYNGETTKDYWLFGLMAEKFFKHFSIIGNVENIFDVRQSKYEKIVMNPNTNPTFKPVWAPLDGMVANIAFHLKLE